VTRGPWDQATLVHAHAQVHMAAGDHAGLIEACARLGDVSRGGDPHLWTEVLQYFGSQQYDCTPQVGGPWALLFVATCATQHVHQICQRPLLLQSVSSASTCFFVRKLNIHDDTGLH
jgi:hypothetical protein